MQKKHIIKLNNRVFRPTDTLNLLLSSLTNQKLKKNLYHLKRSLDYIFGIQNYIC